MTMKKIIIEKVVESCDECDYFHEATYYCSKKKKKLDTPYYAIPTWCPFETIR